MGSVNQPHPSDEVEELRAELSRLNAHHSQTTRPLSHSPRYLSRPLSLPPSPTLCLYHACFGERARKCTPPALLSGNRQGQYIEAIDVAGTHPSHLFYITDQNSNLCFLDTGAQVDVIPSSARARRAPSSLTLQAASNTTIHTYGTHSLHQLDYPGNAISPSPSLLPQSPANPFEAILSEFLTVTWPYVASAELVRGAGASRPSVIVSADRDFYQLIEDNVV